MAPRKTRTPKKTGARPRPAPKPPTPGPGERVWLLDVPFEMRAVAAACGARWDPALRSTVYIGAAPHPGLVPFLAPDLSWAQWLQDDLAGTVTRFPGDGTITPRQDQVDAAESVLKAHALNRPGFLEADDVGTGKTIVALTAIRRLKGPLNVLILCPPAVVAHWRRATRSFGTGDHRFCITNYERAKHLLTVPASAQAAKKTRTRNARVAKEGKSLVEWDIVVLDESHTCRNPAAQRSAIARTLTSGAFTVWMSATAGTDPLALSYLAPLLGEMTGHPVEDLAAFEKWCAAQGIAVTRGDFGKWEWEKNDDDLERIRSILFDGPVPAGIRRVPEDISGWPTINRNLHPVAFDPESRRLYQDAWTEFRRAMELAQRGRNPSDGRVAQTRFRQKASLLRVPGVADLVCDFMANGHQPVVSVVWLETLDALHETLAGRGIPVAVIDGRKNRDEKEAERIRFQTGAAAVCLFTVVDGISLHAGETAVNGNDTPRSTIVADPRWDGYSALQVEGRAHRDGKRSDAWYCFAEETVEERIVTTVIGRMRDGKQLVGDDTETLREIEAVLAGGLQPA